MKRCLLAALLALAACNQPTTQDAQAPTTQPVANRIQAFWQWFEDNKTQYEHIKPGEEPPLDLLLEHLTDLEPGLAAEISAQPNTDSLLELTISAEGDVRKFPLVEQIVAEAPPIKGWKVIAFRQPAPYDFTLQKGHLRLTPAELFFEPIATQDSLDIIVYGQDFGKKDPDTLALYGHIMLDNLMGEYNSAKRVRHYEFRDLSAARRQSDLSPLQDINKFLDDYYQRRQ